MLDFIKKFLFLYHHEVCGILVPWSEIEPMPSAMEAPTSNWIAREILKAVFLYWSCKLLYISYGFWFFFLQKLRWVLFQKPDGF